MRKKKKKKKGNPYEIEKMEDFSNGNSHWSSLHGINGFSLRALTRQTFCISESNFYQTKKRIYTLSFNSEIKFQKDGK